MLAQEIIRFKRDGYVLDGEQIDAFVRGLTDSSWSDAQTASMAMAIYLKGMSDAETAALTQAMSRSGDMLDWSSSNLPGPILDKHSTGGVGDKISLMLAPIVAACGGYVPMISGRGLGHTGGTLDKLGSIPGYEISPTIDRLRDALRHSGCAIVGQTSALAPADRRLYAIRDVTGTVESMPLITASILSKKLAAGLNGLVMDVKVGNGAFAKDLPAARMLAKSLVQVAANAGLPTRAWITDMSQVLGRTCGNAVEVHEALDILRGGQADVRLLEVTRTLSAELLMIGCIAATTDDALARVDAVLANGRAAERFAGMVSALGGPSDFLERSSTYLPVAPVKRAVCAPSSGWITSMSTRDIGLLVLELGGGRRQASDEIDARVGLSEIVSVGQRIEAGDVLAVLHAADDASAAVASRKLIDMFFIGDAALDTNPVLIDYVRA